MGADRALAAIRAQQALFELATSSNRLAGSGAGAGMMPQSLGFAAAGSQGAYSTANSSTWTDISNTSFIIHVNRTSWIEYRIYAAAHLSAAGALGYIRGNIVGFDVSASLMFGPTATTNGFIWYVPLAIGKGPLGPGTYTAKLQAATDNNTFSISVDQFFHHIITHG
jgi:hypothetical protein